ncbi:hypothetical protein ACFFX1_36395 [Dactylosporangium sucinum]|uniref:Uncharacterized protein n=1 Tax=Dactylosporangium sucinum TaxID=1424081 RepID=A0A917WWZ5_9ACTN|nr:hypothetical protein [Dactylosporangium sucinum]GGM37602.1 hypothetical protein GCM10007977_043840 [Dactylosporangium sucinum]
MIAASPLREPVPAVRFDAAAQNVVRAARGAGTVWLILGDASPAGHPMLDAAPCLVIDRRPNAGQDRLLLVRGELRQTRPRLRTDAAQVVPAVAAVLFAIRDCGGDPPRLSGTWQQRRLLGRVRGLVGQIEPDPARRPGVHVW